MGQIVFGITYVGIKFMFILQRKDANAVERLNIDELQSFMSEPVGVTIYDETWADQTPFMSKKIEKAELCSDGTHLRIYFDPERFFAVPLGSEVSITGAEDRKSTRLNSSHVSISYAVFCLK